MKTLKNKCFVGVKISQAAEYRVMFFWNITDEKFLKALNPKPCGNFFKLSTRRPVKLLETPMSQVD